jgi:phenylacetate-coenzyme A ligase PaaK-like adenylate-forming protein
MEPAQQEETLAYMAAQMERFVKPGDSVLLCFPEHREGELSWLYEQAVIRCGGTAVIWGPDHRWKTLLQQAFYSRAKTIIGLPLIILGLTKLKKYNGVPLYIRNVVTAGYPCLDWMIDGIIDGLDCSSWGSFGLGESGVVAGFSCGKSRGVHLREDVYGIDILDNAGNVLPVGETGEMVLYLKSDPSIRFPLGEQGRLETAACACDRATCRLMDMYPGKTKDDDLTELGQYLHSWTSVLDCSVKKGEYGLELELVVFPGEKLPKLPSAAKQVIRPWNPKHDEPFSYVPAVKNGIFSAESH